ncbi:MAG: uncharacterized protein JWM86_1273 [Thermoleophilia bacterium]|nr:uncharacterized protein [Thermoleophilia bacterium]
MPVRRLTLPAAPLSFDGATGAAEARARRRTTISELELGPLRFGIVGAGRLGCTIGRALQQQGFEVVHATSASPAGRERAAHALGVPVHEDPLAACEQVDCALLCVRDDALPSVVRRLAERPATASPMRLRFVSTSAWGGRTVLAPLAALGHATAVLHPMATVADHSVDVAALSGAGAAIGAGDDAESTLAGALAHTLGLHPFPLEEAAWPLHAAACTLASNGPAALLAAAADLAATIGVHDGVARSAYARLAAAAVDRAARMGAVESMAGPILRGDAAAVATQVAAVRHSSTEVDALFIPVVASVANRAFTTGRIDMAAHRSLLEAVLDPTQFVDGEFTHGDGEEGQA